MIALRERPRPLGSGRIGLKTLVASTTSSRLAKSRSARPTTSSLAPSEYMLAVSKKLMPASRRVDEGTAFFFIQNPFAPLAGAVSHAAETQARDFEAGLPN